MESSRTHTPDRQLPYWIFRAAGYLAVPFIPIATIALVSNGLEWLIPVLFFGFLPLAGFFVQGDQFSPEDLPLENHGFCAVMGLLPGIYVITLTMLLGAVMEVIGHGASALRFASLGLSYFVCAMLATCAMHELTHRRELLSLILGRILCGLVGYPHFPEVHRTHHLGSQSAWHEPVPGVGSTVYGHAARLVRHEWTTMRRAKWRGARGLGAIWISLGVVSMIAAAILSFTLAGLSGLIFYGVTVMMIWFGVQSINYVQHYGLPTDSRSAPQAWDHDCPIQAVLTYQISYHDQHHALISRPYYTYDARRNRSCLPGSYAVMFLAALWPPIYWRLMQPLVDKLSAGEASGFVDKEHSPLCSGRFL